MRNSYIEDIINVALSLDNYYSANDSFNITQFDQTWSSTTLGFDGFGGDMMTTAPTTIVYKEDGSVDVWFGRRKAYTVEKPNVKFHKDVMKRSMLAKRLKDKYEEGSTEVECPESCGHLKDGKCNYLGTNWRECLIS